MLFFAFSWLCFLPHARTKVTNKAVSTEFVFKSNVVPQQQAHETRSLSTVPERVGGHTIVCNGALRVDHAKDLRLGASGHFAKSRELELEVVDIDAFGAGIGLLTDGVLRLHTLQTNQNIQASLQREERERERERERKREREREKLRKRRNSPPASI